MLYINDFFVRSKEAVSNQMELLLNKNGGRIIAATRFMGQRALQTNELKDSIYLFPPFLYWIVMIFQVLFSKDDIHVFEEEPSKIKRFFFNMSRKKVYVSMYRRPYRKYAEHLKKYKRLKYVFVELEEHKQKLMGYGIDEDKIVVSPTPSKIPRKKSEKTLDKSNVKIVFASWNSSEGNPLKERGIEYLLNMLKENPTFTLEIPLRDSNTEEFWRMAKAIGVQERINLFWAKDDQEIIDMFDSADFVAFVPQKKIVKDVPNSLIDGLVRGKPIIVSDVIDARYIVEKHGVGFVIPKGEQAKKLRVSADEYADMSKKAFEYSKIHSPQYYVEIISSKY